MTVSASGVMPPEWLGSTQNGEGHHLRVLLEARNPHPFSVNDAPAKAELDLAAILSDAGWISSPSGERRILKSFRMDMDSLRVVELTSLGSPSNGPLDGRQKAFDVSYPSSDPRRFEIPSRTFQGFMANPQESPFDEETNPTITVVWKIPGPLAAGESRYFAVYFDTVFNVDHPPTSYSSTRAGGALDALYWMGPGLELAGVVVPGATGVGAVNVLALDGDTQVTLLAGTPGSPMRAVVPPAGFPPNPTTISGGSRQALYVSSGVTQAFRIIADKPVLGWIGSGGFVPGTNGELVSKEFIFFKGGGSDQTIHFATSSERPTQVTVTPIPPDGSSYVFQLNTPQSPYPYTVGARNAYNDGGFNVAPGCPLTNPMSPSPQLPGPALYRAQVDSGDPVTLQHAPLGALFQAPSRTGNPVGNSFQVAASWSQRHFVNSGAGPSCSAGHATGSWVAALLSGEGNGNVTSFESRLQVDPPGSNSNPTPSPRRIPTAPSVAGPFPLVMRDRPLQFEMKGAEGFLFVGRPGGGVVPLMHGPNAGADGARVFVTTGRTTLIAAYDNTIVGVDSTYLQSGEASTELHLGSGATALLDDKAGEDRLYVSRITSSRPIFVYPMGGQPGTIAALPAFMEITVHSADYRGHLVRIASPSGLDPVTASTVAGKSVTYPLLVTNLGKTFGSDTIRDTIELSVSEPTPGWKARLDRSSIQFTKHGETQQVFLTVTPEDSVAPESLGIVSVAARSKGNQNMEDRIGTVTYLQRSFAVGIWFDVVDIGPKTKPPQAIETDEVLDYVVFVKNEGTVVDTLTLTTNQAQEGWTQQLLRGGVPVNSIRLEPGEHAEIILRVIPPPGATDGLLVSSVTAKSESSPAVFDRVTATTKLRAPTDVKLIPGRTTVRVDPGREALFPIQVRNDGTGTAEIKFDLQSGRRDWPAPSMFVTDPSTGTRRSLSKFSLAPRQVLNAFINISAPAGAAAGDTASIRLAATTSGSTDTAEIYLYAITNTVHRIRVSPPPLPLAVGAAPANVTFRFTVSNLGNLAEDVRTRVEALPPGWNLTLPGRFLVARNSSQSMNADLMAPASTRPGLYNVTVLLVSKDGNVTRLSYSAAVGVVPRFRVLAPPSLETQPGVDGVAPVSLENLGNSPLRIRLGQSAGERWPLNMSVPTQALAAGAKTVLALRWEVPTSEPDGTGVHRATLYLRPDDPDGVEVETGIEVPISVGRPQLRIGELEVFEGPAGLLVHAVILNEGSRPAQGLQVELQADREVVDGARVAVVQAGGRSELTFLLPADSPRAKLVLDPSNLIVEGVEDDNVADVEPPQGAVAASAPGVWMALVVSCLLVRRLRVPP